jgi:hypothetical protein
MRFIYIMAHRTRRGQQPTVMILLVPFNPCDAGGR